MWLASFTDLPTGVAQLKRNLSGMDFFPAFLTLLVFAALLVPFAQALWLSGRQRVAHVGSTSYPFPMRSHLWRDAIGWRCQHGGHSWAGLADDQWLAVGQSSTGRWRGAQLYRRRHDVGPGSHGLTSGLTTLH